MNKNLKIVISILTSLIVIALIILTKYTISYIQLKKIVTSPFNTIEILEKKIRLKENERTYIIDGINCNSLTDNTQLIYYGLNEKSKDNKVSVTSKIFSGDKIITNYENITEIEINISIKDPQNNYEQVYHINAKCKN